MYAPKGRTDEASADYTDDPRTLATRFRREQLEDALEDGVLKFDYEEYVPAEAIREAIEIAKGL